MPAANPDTKPVVETVAKAVFELNHGVVVLAVTDPVNCLVDPTHTDNVPVIVGRELTVIVIDVVFAQEPARGVKLYVVVVVLFTAGDHEPEMPFVDETGNVSAAPEHIGGI